MNPPLIALSLALLAPSLAYLHHLLTAPEAPQWREAAAGLVVIASLYLAMTGSRA